METLARQHEVRWEPENDASFSDVGPSLRDGLCGDREGSILSTSPINSLDGVSPDRFGTRIGVSCGIKTPLFLVRMLEPCFLFSLIGFRMHGDRRFYRAAAFSTHRFFLFFGS